MKNLKIFFEMRIKFTFVLSKTRREFLILDLRPDLIAKMEPLQLRVRSEALAAEKKVAPHAPAPIEFLMWINAKLW